MNQYDVCIEYKAGPQTLVELTRLEGFALGLGLPRFTSFDGTGGRVAQDGTLEFNVVKVFRFIEAFDGPKTVLPWAVRTFAEEARHRLFQSPVLVSAQSVDTWESGA